MHQLFRLLVFVALAGLAAWFFMGLAPDELASQRSSPATPSDASEESSSYIGYENESPTTEDPSITRERLNSMLRQKAGRF